MTCSVVREQQGQVSTIELLLHKKQGTNRIPTCAVFLSCLGACDREHCSSSYYFFSFSNKQT